jgi:hypothetical protein
LVVLLAVVEFQTVGAELPVAVQLSLMAHAARMGWLSVCGVPSEISVPSSEFAMVAATLGLSVEG